MEISDYGNFTPINPTLTEAGNLVVLEKIFGADKAKPVPLPQTENPYRNFHIKGDSISFSLAAKLGLGGVFGGNYSQNDQAFYFDAVAYTDKYTESGSPDKLVTGTRWGTGIRIGLRAYDIKAGMSLTYGIVGAAVDMQLAKSQYEITGIGIGMEGLAAVLGKMPSIGDFNGEVFHSIRKEVFKALTDFMTNPANRSKLYVEPFAVQLISPVDDDPSSKGRSVYFAYRCLSKRRPLVEAIKISPANVDKNLVRLIYTQVAGNIPETEKPSGAAEDKADKWLDL